MLNSPTNNGMAIVGGGISGLYAALRAIDNGQRDVHVYEASERLGGKIKSQVLQGKSFCMGAEFIDSDDSLTIELCQRLGLELIEGPDQKTQAFQGSDGKIHTDFFTQYTPVALQIIQDRKDMLANPDGALAHRISTLSLAEYMEELRSRPEFSSLPPSVFEIALNSFTAEVGHLRVSVRRTL